MPQHGKALCKRVVAKVREREREREREKGEFISHGFGDDLVIIAQRIIPISVLTHIP